MAYVSFLTETLHLTISVVFTLFGHCFNTKICQFSFQNLGFSFPESHQVDIFQGMTQNFTPHINLITTKTPAITLLYTLLLSPISLLGNQAQLASAHSLAPLHNISSLSLSRVFADWLVRLSVSALVVTLPRAGLDWAPYRQQRVSRGGRVIRQTVVLTRLPALLTLSADLWQHWLYAACLTRLHLRLQNDNNGVQEEAKSSQNGYSLGCQTDLATSNWRDSVDSLTVLQPPQPGSAEAPSQNCWSVWADTIYLVLKCLF